MTIVGLLRRRLGEVGKVGEVERHKDGTKSEIVQMTTRHRTGSLIELRVSHEVCYEEALGARS